MIYLAHIFHEPSKVSVRKLHELELGRLCTEIKVIGLYLRAFTLFKAQFPLTPLFNVPGTAPC